MVLNCEETNLSMLLPTEPYKRLHCNQSAVRSVRFNSDGLYCMTAGGDKTIKLWNPYNCRLLKTYTGHSGEVLVVDSSRDNSQIASGGSDCLVMLWDVASGQSVRRWRKHAGPVNAIRFIDAFSKAEEVAPSPILLSGSVDGMVLVWDTRARNAYPVQIMHEARDSITCLTYCRNQIITGSVDRCLRVYDIRRGEMTENYVGYPITSVSITRDCQCILVGTHDSSLRLFDALTGDLLNKYTGHVNKIYKMDSVLMNNDRFIATGSENDALVYIWDFVRSDSVHHILDHTPGGIAWSNLETQNTGPVSQLVVQTSKFNNFFVHSLSNHPTENKLLTAGADFIWLWDAEYKLYNVDYDKKP